MKRCPNCTTDYFDDMLEFCLEDGAKLSIVSKSVKDVPTVIKPFIAVPSTEKNFNLQPTEEIKTVESVKSNDVQATRQNHPLIENISHSGLKIFEVLPVVLALTHNWWQWLYVTNQSYSSISGFLISANFLIWLLLLAIGAGISLLAIRRCENKGYAFTSLVILSINLILFLVPKR